jgi:hypothetical protein
LEKNVIDFEKNVEIELQTCSAQMDEKRQAVLDLLLKGVSRCEPNIHPNAQLKLKQKGGPQF